MNITSYTTETSCAYTPITWLGDNGTKSYVQGPLEEIITCKWSDSGNAYEYDGTATSIEYDPWITANNATSATNINYKQVMRRLKNAAKSGWLWEGFCEYGYDSESKNGWVVARSPVKTPGERIREIIQSRQSPLIVRARKIVGPTEDVREMRARETLRRVLGEEGFRAFIRNGFVSVRARSGLTYQIFPGHDITNVYRDGERVERLCVVLRGNFPPTDSLIMRYLLILNDEQDFRSHAIAHKVYPQKMAARVTVEATPKSLPELFRGMKVA